MRRPPLALALALLAGASGEAPPPALPDGAAALDDECLAGGGGCALSALQRRKKAKTLRQRSDAVLAEEASEKAEEEVEEEETQGASVEIYAGAGWTGDLALDKAPPPTPVSAQGTCSFEDQAGDCSLWYNADGDQFDWSTRSGPTPSFDTGPDQAADQSKYIYIEASSPRVSGDKAVLRSAPLILNGPMAMEFEYHMYGYNMGTLEVEVDGTAVWQESGNKGNQWHHASIDLSGYTSPVVVSVTGTRGPGFTGDIALDKVAFVPVTPSTTAAPGPPGPVTGTLPPNVTYPPGNGTSPPWPPQSRT